MPLVTRALGTGGFITGHTSFSASAEIPFHSHKCEERGVLMQGRTALDMDGLQYELKPHDATYIAPGISRRFRSLSKTEPMKIFWIYAGTDDTRTDTATGATQPSLLRALRQALVRRARMKVLVLPGDGIGPELIASAVEVLEAVDRRRSPVHPQVLCVQHAAAAVKTSGRARRRCSWRTRRDRPGPARPPPDPPRNPH